MGLLPRARRARGQPALGPAARGAGRYRRAQVWGGSGVCSRADAGIYQAWQGRGARLYLTLSTAPAQDRYPTDEEAGWQRARATTSLEASLWRPGPRRGRTWERPLGGSPCAPISERPRDGQAGHHAVIREEPWPHSLGSLPFNQVCRNHHGLHRRQLSCGEASARQGIRGRKAPGKGRQRTRLSSSPGSWDPGIQLRTRGEVTALPAPATGPSYLTPNLAPGWAAGMTAVTPPKGRMALSSANAGSCCWLPSSLGGTQGACREPSGDTSGPWGPSPAGSPWEGLPLPGHPQGPRPWAAHLAACVRGVKPASGRLSALRTPSGRGEAAP